MIERYKDIYLKILISFDTNILQSIKFISTESIFFILIRSYFKSEIIIFNEELFFKCVSLIWYQAFRGK